MGQELERKFLHDLAGPLTICRLALTKAMEEIQAEPPTEFMHRIRGRIEKALQSMKAAEELHAAHRLAILQESENQGKATSSLGT